MRRLVTVVCPIVLLVFGLMATAQQPSSVSVPNLIEYGGTLPQSKSAIVQSRTVGVTFAIYKHQEEGAPVWMETQNVTLDAGGHYSVMLGSTRAEGLPADLFSAQEERWLGVQVQGQPEQARVLLVSVPYAMKAAEADRLAGHSASEFVTTETLQSAVRQQLQRGGVAIVNSVGEGDQSAEAGNVLPPSNPATSFVDTTTNQVVLVQQNGTGVGLSASAPSSSAIVGTTNASAFPSIIAGVKGVSSLNASYGVYGRATSTSSTQPGIGVYGVSDSPNGFGLSGWAAGTGSTIGLQGGASSTSGQAINATETATSGSTVGLVARVYSPTGIGALILNNSTSPVTGTLISARTLNGVQFSVGGTGNVVSQGTISGTRLISTVATGTAPLTVTSTTQVPNLNASLLGGFGPGHFAPNFGATNYIQNTFAPQNANFNITGNGNIGGQFSVQNGVQAFNSSQNNAAIMAHDNNILGFSEGIDSETQNPIGIAVHGQEQASSGLGIGVLGESNSTDGAGVIGASNAVTGTNYGVVGYSASPVGFGVVGASPGVATAGFTQTCISLDVCTLTTGIAGQFATQTGGTLLLGKSGADLNSLATVFSLDSSGKLMAAGVPTSTVTGVAVYVDAGGHFGVQSSSERFKEQIRDMGESTSALMKLRPVTFLYKPEYDKGARTLQYGLIAEEVAKVYPELVAYGEDGKPYTVKYQYLASMLLNEVQKQQHRAEAEAGVIKTQQQEIDGLRQQLRVQNATMQERLSRLESLVERQTAVNLGQK
jgi:trimeric autotransporter adhesin